MLSRTKRDQITFSCDVAFLFKTNHMPALLYERFQAWQDMGNAKAGKNPCFPSLVVIMQAACVASRSWRSHSRLVQTRFNTAKLFLYKNSPAEAA